MSCILYVEDDKDLAYLTKDQMELQGHEVIHCEDGLEALKAIKKKRFDICVLDIMLPEVDGFTLAQKIREQNIHTPILFLTAKAMQKDRLKGFEIGGDDYLTKPFHTEELMYKLEVFSKRREIKEDEPYQNYTLGIYNFDPANLNLSTGGTDKRLTAREAEVLLHLAKNKNELVKRDDILMSVWGKKDYFLGRSLDVFISRLRKYLGDDPSLLIENVHGVGFRLKA